MLSVFPVSTFKQQWLDVQENLQKQLGFECLDVFDFFKNLNIPTFVVTKEIKTVQAETKPRIQYSENDVKEWLENSEYESYCQLIFEENPEPNVSFELGHVLASHLAKQTLTDLEAKHSRLGLNRAGVESKFYSEGALGELNPTLKTVLDILKGISSVRGR